MTATWLDLAAAIGVAPALSGARCRGKPHLFDPGEPHEPTELVAQRHALALELCEHCPSLDACRDWVDGLPKSKRPTGVVAGGVNQTPRGRPRRST